MNQTNNFSMLHLFNGSDFVVLIASLILVAGSVYSWMVIIEKIRLYLAEKKKSSIFDRFNAKLKDIDDKFIKDSLKLSTEQKKSLIKQYQTKLDNLTEVLISPFDNRLYFLSLATVVSPFIGLFGTIWGIMQTFMSIGANQSASIAVIAPGLSMALGTTALGLMVAIPASIFYHLFAKRADDMYSKLEIIKKDRVSKMASEILVGGK